MLGKYYLTAMVVISGLGYVNHIFFSNDKSEHIEFLDMHVRGDQCIVSMDQMQAKRNEQASNFDFCRD
jgi:hypothetical protein